MIKKQISPNLRTSERIVLIACIAIILLMAVMSLGFIVYFYLFIPLLILDAIVFVFARKTRAPEMLLRFLLLVNIVAALVSIYFIIGNTVPWILV